MANDSLQEFFTRIKNPLIYRLFLMKNLPAAWFSGIKLVHTEARRCVVSVPYKWFTRNPFRSTYFACLSMAAEMSTGVLAMGATYRRKQAISLLVTAIEGKFYKKATGLSFFTCEEGHLVAACVDKAIETGEPQSVRLLSLGKNEANELIAEFVVEWSFKVKQKRN